MAFVNSFSWYQPNLLVKNINKQITINTIFQVFSPLNYGVIDKIEIADDGKTNSATIIYKYWYPNKTKSTRILLDSGKSLSIYYDEYKFWRVFAVSEYPKNSLSRFIKENEKKIIKVQPSVIKREIESFEDEKDEEDEEDQDNYKDVDKSNPEDRPIAPNYGVVKIPKRYRKPVKTSKK